MHYHDDIDLTVEPWEPNLTTHIEDSVKWGSFIKKGMPIPSPEDPIYSYTQVGVFEGAGNFEKGVYRPAYDCRMRTNNAQDFCPVCRDAIFKMFDFYTDYPRYDSNDLTGR